MSKLIGKTGPNITGHYLYSTWRTMISRCYNKNHKQYKNYGKRGIRVCSRWLSRYDGFIRFILDMGDRPAKNHSIDRIDVNGNYTPSNCRWATNRQQVLNRRKPVKMILNETYPEFSKRVGVPLHTVRTQMKNGKCQWPVPFKGTEYEKRIYDRKCRWLQNNPKKTKTKTDNTNVTWINDLDKEFESIYNEDRSNDY